MKNVREAMYWFTTYLFGVTGYILLNYLDPHYNWLYEAARPLGLS
ncbi:hypothetical protein [Thalassobacillus sp. CUG 92003]|nr:hypothetical protein [Thalassobacillus sp. CUG 92003]